MSLPLKRVLAVVCVSAFALATTAAQAADPAPASSPTVVKRVEGAVKRGASAAERGIEKGVSATASGVKRAASAAERGAKAAGGAIERTAARIGLPASGGASSPAQTTPPQQ